MPHGTTVTIVVVMDANVLINLTHIGKLSLLDALERFDFRVPTEVLAEISEPEQRVAVAAAVEAGYLNEITIDTNEALALFGELRSVMGHGEAACLALAATSGFQIASDEKKRFRRKAVECSVQIGSSEPNRFSSKQFARSTSLYLRRMGSRRSWKRRSTRCLSQASPTFYRTSRSADCAM